MLFILVSVYFLKCNLKRMRIIHKSSINEPNPPVDCDLMTVGVFRPPHATCPVLAPNSPPSTRCACLFPLSHDDRLFLRRQRLELNVDTLQLHGERLIDFCRVLVHAAFLGGPPMVPRDWALQQRLEVELREVFTCPGTTIADLRDLALRVSESRPKRRQSRTRAAPLGRLHGFDLASFRRRRKEGAAGMPGSAGDTHQSSSSRALVATELEDLQTERNPLCWEAMLRVRRWRAEVALGGVLALSGAELRLECGKLQFGLAALCEAHGLSCSWTAGGERTVPKKERHFKISNLIFSILCSFTKTHASRFISKE